MGWGSSGVSRRGRERVLVTLMIAFVLGGCPTRKLGKGDDAGATRCDVHDAGTSPACEPSDGGDAVARDADGDAHPDGDARSDGDGLFRCARNEDCIGLTSGDAGVTSGAGADGGVRNAARVCEETTGACVGCLARTDCGGRTPICDQQSCRACRADSECADPGICLPDGHCAMATEVVFVEYKGSGCGGVDGGTNTSPYCNVSEGLAAVTSARNVLVIRGEVPDRLASSTFAGPIYIVGKPGGGGEPATFRAHAKTAVEVSFGEVHIRDVTVIDGEDAAARGIVAKGSSTKVTLDRVTVNLGLGFGIEASTGATLRMDRCLVENNSDGALAINGAGYDIQNSVFAGVSTILVQFSSSSHPGTPRFRFNSIVSAGGVAAHCDFANVRTLSESIIVGITSCNIVNSIDVVPPFDVNRPYHLESPLPCPDGGPASVPAHDFDGEPRVAPFDCGADEYGP